MFIDTDIYITSSEFICNGAIETDRKYEYTEETYRIIFRGGSSWESAGDDRIIINKRVSNIIFPSSTDQWPGIPSKAFHGCKENYVTRPLDQRRRTQ
ncbi:hypothetical protein N7488_008906 [Penicillium malachiteum]|nr:hypothetical protein N7488_008906 [Penicillium malachiteum]